jgi:hypothetical protein
MMMKNVMWNTHGSLMLFTNPQKLVGNFKVTTTAVEAGETKSVPCGINFLHAQSKFCRGSFRKTKLEKKIDCISA